MISDKLIPMIQQKYPEKEVRFSSPPDPIVVFPGRHPRVGDLQIYDYGDEATVVITEITHGHFNPYDPELSPEELDKEVAEEVLNFLEELFEDRILLWRYRNGRSAGWQYLDLAEGPRELGKDTEKYLWSGPYVARDNE